MGPHSLAPFGVGDVPNKINNEYDRRSEEGNILYRAFLILQLDVRNHNLGPVELEELHSRSIGIYIWTSKSAQWTTQHDVELVNGALLQPRRKCIAPARTPLEKKGGRTYTKPNITTSSTVLIVTNSSSSRQNRNGAVSVIGRVVVRSSILAVAPDMISVLELPPDDLAQLKGTGWRYQVGWGEVQHNMCVCV